MATVVVGEFEWDSVKAASNAIKHGVSFEEAAQVFSDPGAVEIEDCDFGRVLTIGFSFYARLLLVVSAESTERTRILSARKATTHEQARYAIGF